MEPKYLLTFVCTSSCWANGIKSFGKYTNGKRKLQRVWLSLTLLSRRQGKQSCLILLSALLLPDLSPLIYPGHRAWIRLTYGYSVISAKIIDLKSCLFLGLSVSWSCSVSISLNCRRRLGHELMSQVTSGHVGSRLSIGSQLLTIFFPIGCIIYG